MRSYVEVNIKVVDANECNADVRLTQPLLAGNSIPEEIVVAAAETAAMAMTALSLDQSYPIHRDKSR